MTATRVARARAAGCRLFADARDTFAAYLLAAAVAGLALALLIAVTRPLGVALLHLAAGRP